MWGYPKPTIPSKSPSWKASPIYYVISMKTASFKFMPFTWILSLLMYPFNVPLPKVISTSFPISPNVALFFLSYWLDLVHPISWHNLLVIHVRADPVSKITLNTLAPSSVPTFRGPMNMVFPTFSSGTFPLTLSTLAMSSFEITLLLNNSLKKSWVSPSNPSSMALSAGSRVSP